MQRISPFLWFDTQAEDAVKFYISIFKNSKIEKITRCPEEAAKKIGREPGSVLTVEFTLDGEEFVALKGRLSGSQATQKMDPAGNDVTRRGRLPSGSIK